MGSWNHTCMLSQMHVRDDDDIVELWLVEQDHYKPRGQLSHLTYSTALWKPYPVVMYGKYTDYGETDAGHDLSNPRNALLLKLIQRDIIEREIGENEFHDHAVVKADLDFERLHTIDHGGRASTMGWRQNECAIKHVVIKRSLFDKIINEFTVEEYVRDETHKWGGYSKQVSFADVTANLVEDVQWVLNDLFKDEEPIEGLQPDEIAHMRAVRRMLMYDGVASKYWNNEEAPAFVKYMGDHSGSSEASAGSVRYFSDKEFDNLTVEQLAAHIEEHLKFQWLHYFMDSTRKMWCPQTGQGSQSQDLAGYQLLADFYTEDVAAQKAEQAAWDNEED